MPPSPRPALFALLALLPAAVQDPPKPAAPSLPANEALAKLAWLSGTWVLQDGNVITEEHWRPLQGDTLIGTTHVYDDKKTRSFEFLRITAMNGTIAYVAQPGGRPPVAFPLAKLTDDAVVFENAQHDHPQRIRYEKTAAGVTATVSQLDGSRPQGYVYKKK